MHRISPNNRQSRDINRQTKREENFVEKLTKKKTNIKSLEHFLQDERWDILPKTDYTYAKSGSYSPRFFGRKYVNPNMSRYLIHRRQRDGGEISSEEDDELLYGEYMEYSDEDKDLNDTESDVSHERVLEDGMSLRSGKSLQTMREILHEHDAKLQQSEMINSITRSMSTTSGLLTSSSRAVRSDQVNTNENATSKSTSKKGLHLKDNQKHYSQSDRKNTQSDIGFVNKYNQTSNARSRRNLNTDFSKNAEDVAQQSVNNSSRNLRHKSGAQASYDEIDSGNSKSGYSVRTATKTVTEEYDELDHGFPEKGSVEASEKQANARHNSHKGKQLVKNNINLYGLDYDGEFSDSDTAYTRRSGFSNGSSRSSYSTTSSSSSSTVSTIITTVTETISSVTSPIVKPLWKHIGQPVTTHVGRPLIATVITVLTAVTSLVRLLVWGPVTSLVRTILRTFSWLFSGELLGRLVNTVQNGAVWLWEKVEYVSWKITSLDVWMFQRRRSCCCCLPLLLLLPLPLALLTGFSLWDDNSIFVGMFGGQKQAPQVVINEKHEYYSQLNEEVRNMTLQMQASTRTQLTAADVEAIVYRILNKESTLWKADIEDSRVKDQASQAQWKTEQEQNRIVMEQKQDNLLLNIQSLEAAIAEEKTKLASLEGAQKSESVKTLASLEVKLAALREELASLEEKYAALLARINYCCRNESYYAALVKDNVDMLLAQLISGQPSDNPSQAAFTAWLHANYVSREAIDERLKDLSSELTASMVAMIKDLQSQKQAEDTTASLHVVDNRSGMGEQEVRAMIEEALFRFSADKTGLADFALESAGGSIVSTRCSETFYRKTALVSVLGIPLWYTSNSPRTIIQPEVYPGQCWAFRGKQGYIVIQTSTLITPTGFTLEHIPKSLAPSGKIDSAPKEFTVLGLKSEYDGSGFSLGNFTYAEDGKPIQFFPIQLKEEISPFILYELRILGNHGNEEYTCIYRFRIHGKPYKKP